MQHLVTLPSGRLVPCPEIASRPLSLQLYYERPLLAQYQMSDIKKFSNVNAIRNFDGLFRLDGKIAVITGGKNSIAPKIGPQSSSNAALFDFPVKMVNAGGCDHIYVPQH